MGCYFRAKKVFWSSFIVVFMSSFTFAHPDSGKFLSDLGIDVFPDRAKINISLQEYTRVISDFLNSRDMSFEPVPSLRVYKLDNLIKHHRPQQHIKMIFPIGITTDQIESASLRLLMPPQQENPTIANVQIYQILGTRRKRLLTEDTFNLSRNLSKWCEVNVTEAVASWTEGSKNLGLELTCESCSNNLNPEIAAITALVHPQGRRIKRSPKKGRTDCSARHQTGKGKKKCCRHDMMVTFTKLGFNEMKDIVEPKNYEAGYCHGMCPPNYNFATNHSRIQGLMHQLDKSYFKQFKNKTSIVPKTCCAPSKLGDLEILIVSSHDPTKLKVEKWHNMRVLECACS
ncbi:hypothetical protein ABEB36_011164 [Hypothenemus hampei]|uniref:TGF-beta family profile domain-containing protein n=1 Tax=Hypothenemus hampei TaxID=57062 RepID=A0ABD1EF23_HYPHA